MGQSLALGTPSFVVIPDGQALLYAAIDDSHSEIELRSGAFKATGHCSKAAAMRFC